MTVACAWARQDAPGGLTTDAWCETYGVTRAVSLEELTERNDAIVLLSPDYHELHEALCQIPLRSGQARVCG